MAVAICTLTAFNGAVLLLCVLTKLAVCPRVEGFATFRELSTSKMIIRMASVECVLVRLLPALRVPSLSGLYK